MKTKTILRASLILSAIFGPFATSSAEEPENVFTIDAQVLARGELRRGGIPIIKTDAETQGEYEKDEDLPTQKVNFISGRARLSLGFEKKWLTAKIAAQHSGIWGDVTGGTFNIYEAWGMVKSDNGLFAKFGRQALAYDDERIIGANDWSMTGSSHDALKLGYEGHNHMAHLILGYNQNAKNVAEGTTTYINGFQPHKSLATLWYHYDFKKIPLGISAIGMNIGMQGFENEAIEGKEKPKTYYQQIVGSYVKYSPSVFSAEASYYRQMGRNESNMKIDAWMASAKFSFTPCDIYGVTTGYDYLSGDKFFAVPPSGQIGLIHHDVLRGFNPVYGSHHQFYGAMDFFYVRTFVNGFTPGLQNLYISGSYSPTKNLNFNAAYHHFAITADLPGISKNLGDEIELTGSYNFIKDANISAGYSYMKGTKTMEILKRASNRRNLNWAWLSISISPRLFTTKW